MATEQEINLAERMKYVEKWAQYVLTHDDWSTLQKELINSQLENAATIRLTKEQIEKIKSVSKLSKEFSS